MAGQHRVMTNQRGVLYDGGPDYGRRLLPGHVLGHDSGPGRGPGHNSDHGHGHGRGNGSGHGRGPGHGNNCRHGSGPGPGHGHGNDSGFGHCRGRGRGIDAINRFIQNSGNIAGSRLVGEFALGCPHNAGLQNSRPGLPPSLSGLNDVLLGPRSVARGFIPTKAGTNVTSPAIGFATRGRRLSWADMRRQCQWNGSQRSNSTADESSEPDKSHQGFLKLGRPDGGWGGRGRGRLLDTSSIKKDDSSKCNMDNSTWGGRGRGGILYVPGYHFHNGLHSTGWKNSEPSYQRKPNLCHSTRGPATNTVIQSAQSLEGKEEVNVSSSKQQQNKKHQGWKKHKKWKAKNNMVNNVKLHPVKSSAREDSQTHNSIVSSVQQTNEKSSSVLENSQHEPSDVSDVVTDANTPANQATSLAKVGDRKVIDQGKHTKVDTLEGNLREQLVIGANAVSDAISANKQNSNKPVKCFTEQQSDRKEIWKPVHCSNRGSHKHGILIFGSRIVTDRGTAETQNTVVCGRGNEEKPADQQTILTTETSCSDKVCGAVM